VKVVRSPQSELKFVRKTVTLTGAAGLGALGTPTIALFTVTGMNSVALIVGRCTTSLTSAGGGTLILGVTGSTSLFIGVTTGTALTTTNNIWMTTTPTANGLAAPAAVKDITITQNIIATVATADITAGVLEFDVYYLPLSPGASIV
jgi:hypothetical protein